MENCADHTMNTRPEAGLRRLDLASRAGLGPALPSLAPPSGPRRTPIIPPPPSPPSPPANPLQTRHASASPAAPSSRQLRASGLFPLRSVSERARRRAIEPLAGWPRPSVYAHQTAARLCQLTRRPREASDSLINDILPLISRRLIEGVRAVLREGC